MSEIAFKILRINRNEQDRKEFEDLLNYQTKCFDEFSEIKTNILSNNQFLTDNIKKYKELLGVEDIEININ